MGSGGNIDIRAALLSAAEAGVSESSHSQYVMLSIDDDGPGMDPITIQKAFDPYFTTKPVGSGSGLGLAQVLSFARQSGGDARLVSAIGEGTTVQILLPVTSEQPPVAVESAPAALTVGRPLRVLMVEDDPLVASVVAPAIQGAGHAVTHCTSADEAKSLLAQSQNKFDVVFSDVVMPGTISGIDLAEWCRGLAQPIPVVLATGYTAQTPQTDLTVLRKPYQLDELLKALQDAAP